MRRHEIPTLTGAEELLTRPDEPRHLLDPAEQTMFVFWAISAARTATSCASGCGVVTDNDVGPAGGAGRARSRRRPTPCGMSGAPLAVIGLGVALGLEPAARTHQPIAELQGSGPGPPECRLAATLLPRPRTRAFLSCRRSPRGLRKGDLRRLRVLRLLLRRVLAFGSLRQRLETLAVARSLEPCKQILGHNRPVPRPPAVEQKFGEHRGKRLTSLILEAPARCDHLIYRLAAAERGKHAPRGGAGVRT